MKKTWHMTEGYIKNLFHDPKKQLLDPLCALTSIIELLFRPIGTKFGIYNHSIISNQRLIYFIIIQKKRLKNSILNYLQFDSTIVPD